MSAQDWRMLLVCPACRGELSGDSKKEQVLCCLSCRLSYPVLDGIPHLLAEAATPLSASSAFVPDDKADK